MFGGRYAGDVDQLGQPVVKRAWLLIGAGAALFVLYAGRQGRATTAGDEDSNFIEDGYADIMNTLQAWPPGSGPYQGAIQDAATQYGVPVMVLAWLLWKESRYSQAVVNGTRRSSVGAMGIAQFMPATAREELGSVEAALDPDTAIPGAARYLAKLYRSAGSWTGALAAYNWGIGNVQRKGIAAAPAETRDYYTTIMSKAGLVEEGAA